MSLVTFQMLQLETLHMSESIFVCHKCWWREKGGGASWCLVAKMFITFPLTNITTFIAHHQSELQPVESIQGVRVFCLPRISVFFPELSVFFPKQTFAKQVEILMLLDHFAGGPRAKSRRGTSDYCLNNLSNDNNYPPNNHNDSHIYRSLAGLGCESDCTHHCRSSDRTTTSSPSFHNPLMLFPWNGSTSSANLNQQASPGIKRDSSSASHASQLLPSRAKSKLKSEFNAPVRLGRVLILGKQRATRCLVE